MVNGPPISPEKYTFTKSTNWCQGLGIVGVMLWAGEVVLV